MKPALWVLALGGLALVVQGGLATFLPPPYCPDLSLLVVIGLGLRWQRFSSGVLLTAVLGYAADFLSGSLLGQHALLRIFVFAGARLASRQLNLRGPIPLSVFAAGVTALYALGLLALSGFFAPPEAGAWLWLSDTLPHALVNALLAPAVSSGMERVLGSAADDDAARRILPFQPNGRSA